VAISNKLQLEGITSNQSFWAVLANVAISQLPIKILTSPLDLVTHCVLKEGNNLAIR